MHQEKRSTVVGVFDNREQAQRAVNELHRAGFREDEIGVVARDGGGTVTDKLPEERGDRVGSGAATGAIAGAGTGALWAIGIATIGLPAIGPVVAGGLLGSVLASAAGTAVAGGVLGALVGMGIPEEEAREYEDEFKSGRTLVTVKSDTRSEEARNILRNSGARLRDTTPATHSGARTAQAVHANTGARSAEARSEGQTMRVHEEELHAHKQPVQTGEVKARKEVHTEHKTLDVPVEREEVVMERRPAAGRPDGGAGLQEGREIRMPVKEEKVHLEKKPVVKEEVSLGKHKVKGTERVGGDVRKEEAKLEREGAAKMHGDGDGANCPQDANRAKAR